MRGARGAHRQRADHRRPGRGRKRRLAPACPSRSAHRGRSRPRAEPARSIASAFRSPSITAGLPKPMPRRPVTSVPPILACRLSKRSADGIEFQRAFQRDRRRRPQAHPARAHAAASRATDRSTMSSAPLRSSVASERTVPAARRSILADASRVSIRISPSGLPASESVIAARAGAPTGAMRSAAIRPDQRIHVRCVEARLHATRHRRARYSSFRSARASDRACLRRADRWPRTR